MGQEQNSKKPEQDTNQEQKEKSEQTSDQEQADKSEQQSSNQKQESSKGDAADSKEHSDQEQPEQKATDQRQEDNSQEGKSKEANVSPKQVLEFLKQANLIKMDASLESLLEQGQIAPSTEWGLLMASGHWLLIWRRKGL